MAKKSLLSVAAPGASSLGGCRAALRCASGGGLPLLSPPFAWREEMSEDYRRRENYRRGMETIPADKPAPSGGWLGDVTAEQVNEFKALVKVRGDAP